MPRKLGLCVENWQSQDNHYAWMWTKKRLLQGLRQSGEDLLYIIHVRRGRNQARWDLGGPLIGDAQSELQGLNYQIVDLQGDAVSEVLKFAEEKKLDILILGSKAYGRVRRTVSRGTSVQVAQKACCACVLVSPRITAGEQIRIQAARQADTMASVISMQFCRKVAIVLNAGSYDANLVQYAARNVLLPGDRVTVVRCLSKNILNRQKRESLEQEKGSAREIGRNKLMGADVAMSVEILSGGLRVLCNTIESKGIDLVVFMRTEEKRIRRPMPTGALTLQSLPHRCPCPCMVVPMACLKLFSGSNGPTSCGLPQLSALNQTPSLSEHMLRMAKRAKPGPINIRLRRGRQRTRSLDSVGRDFNSDDARVLEVIADEAIELEAIEELDLESEVSGKAKSRDESSDEGVVSPFSRQGSMPISSVSSSCPTPVPIDLRRKSVGDLVTNLQKQLEERDQEIMELKEQISVLQSDCMRQKDET